MVEHLFCKQAVAGSIPIAGSIFDTGGLDSMAPRSYQMVNGDQIKSMRSSFTERIINDELLSLHIMPGGVMVAQQTLTLLV